MDLRPTTAGLVIPRAVRKTLSRLQLWNPRRHRVSRNPGRLGSLAGAEAAAVSPVTTAVPPPTLPTSGPRAVSWLLASTLDRFVITQLTSVTSSNNTMLICLRFAKAGKRRKAIYRFAPFVQPDIGVSTPPVRPVGAHRRVSGAVESFSSTETASSQSESRSTPSRERSNSF